MDGPLVSKRWVEDYERKIGPFTYEFWHVRKKGMALLALHFAPFAFEVEDSIHVRNAILRVGKLNLVINF